MNLSNHQTTNKKPKLKPARTNFSIVSQTIVVYSRPSRTVYRQSGHSNRPNSTLPLSSNLKAYSTHVQAFCKGLTRLIDTLDVRQQGCQKWRNCQHVPGDRSDVRIPFLVGFPPFELITVFVPYFSCA